MQYDRGHRELIERRHKFLGTYTIFFSLGLILVALKLLGVISWGWIYVTAPLWWPLALVASFMGVVLVRKVFGC